MGRQTTDKFMKFKLIALLPALPITVQSAEISFAGSINDNNGSEITEWKTSGTLKTLDGDGDNQYGTLAHLFYRIQFKGQNTLYTFNGSDSQVGPFPGYATVDHPDGISADTQVRTTTSGGGAGPDEVMFTFTAQAGSPANVRIGIATDGLNGAQFTPATIGVRQVGGTSIEHTLTSVNNTIDMVFFDLIGIATSDQFQIFADAGTGGFATHQFVTWDVIDPTDLTDPTDSDADNMGDAWENFFFGSLTASDGTGDADNDGVTDLQEWNAMTNPTRNDTDNDGLSDGAEINTYGTDPASNDSDSDGLFDKFEIDYNLDPNDPNGMNGAAGDPDADTLDNLGEQIAGTNPQERDTDADGYDDNVEDNSKSWTSATTGTGTDPLNPDSDGDGLENGVENPDQPYDPGNPSGQPGTNPNIFDSDFDGANDGYETQNGTDPTSNSSTPLPSATLWSVDIQAIPGIFANNPVLMTGSEPNSGIYSGVWNAFEFTGHDSTVTDPTMSLVNARGEASPVTFSITGIVSGWANAPGANALINDYLFVNAGNAAASANWSITGLRPSTEYVFYPYAGITRDMTLTVDTNGDGLLTDETPTRVQGAGSKFTIVTSTSGQLLGEIGPGNSGEANWGGWQLISSTELPIIDTDMDGLSDDDENIAGTDRFNPDTDGDGQSDGAEVRAAGTDPLDPTSFLGVTNILHDGDSVDLTWTSIPGKFYAVEGTTDLEDWTEISSNITAADNPATTTSATVDVPGATPFKAYRVVVRR